MKIKLRRMTLQEFKAFCEYSINDYAKDLVREKHIDSERALSQAKKEFMEMLPDGLDTPDNELMVIERIIDSAEAGFIWYLYEMTEGVKQAFVSDFVVKEEERRKGYATEALAEMEKKAVESGCAESILYVSKDNAPGINLYTNCGYIAFRPTEDGMYMKKVIA